jgi:glycosyltransferase involved in cell wall biosynthesis
MNILMICPQFYPWIGGAEIAAQRLAREFSLHQVTVQVVAERTKRAWPAKELIQGVSVRRLPRLFDNYLGAILFKFCLILFLIFRGRRYSVWNVNQIGYNACLAILVGKLLRRPVILRLTGVGVTGIEKRVSAVPFSFVCRTLSKWADAYICLSHETYKDALDFGLAPSRLFLIPNGIDLDEFHPASLEERIARKREFGLDGRSIALFVGRFAKEKNAIGLVHAWGQMQPSLRQEWMLVLVGDGAEREILKKVIDQHELQDSVLLAGASVRVVEWLHAADLFILPSWGEGLSNALLEAMACGLPVVATDVSGVNQLVGISQCGLIARNGESECIRECLEQLMNEENGTLQTMGIRGRELIAREYTMKTVSQKYLNLYAQLIHGG